ncbi:unnamed protein product [Thlaspi arvense]|uniref:Uncharacterized protein n=1 Tax=Thlaspi arvense TaxID=13288 RepID=A0AAU9RR39_THLAR|nr:unnamed protein product [Thlaspi arvense]
MKCDYVFVTQESEPSSVIASSITSMPDGSTPVEATVSTSTPSPVQSSSLTPPATTSVSSEPAPLFVPNMFSSDAFGPPTPSELGRPIQAPAFSFGDGTLSSSAPTQALGPTTSSEPAQASVTDLAASLFTSWQTHSFGSGASAGSTSSTSSPFAAPTPFRCESMQAPPTFGSGASAASTSSTSSPFASTFQPSAPNSSSLFSFRPAQDASASPSAFAFNVPNAGFSPPASSTAPENLFNRLVHVTGGGDTNYWPGPPSNTFGPSRNSFFPGSGVDYLASEGSRYPPYAPTPSEDPYKMMSSISASDYYAHKSHEELRWEDYKRGDKGGVGSFPAAHISSQFSRPNAFFSQPTVTPSPFASPRIPYHSPPSSFAPPRTPDHSPSSLFAPPRRPDFPAAVQRPHDGVSYQASGCTTCGATSSSFPSGPTNPPSVPLPGSWFSTSGYYPNLAAQGTRTTPALQPYPMMFGPTYLAAQGTATTPALQAYPMMFAAQGTNLAVQSATPAFQAYPMMPGATTAAQVTNLGVQSTTPAVQAYPVAGYILVPFPTMNLQ